MSAGFTTTGGPGSIFADLDGIARVGVRHGELREDLVHLAAAVEATERAMAGTGRVSPAAGRLAELLRTGVEDCRALSGRCGELSRDLAAAVATYRAAEQGAAAVVDAEDPLLDEVVPLAQRLGEGGWSAAELELVARAGVEGLQERVIADALTALTLALGRKALHRSLTPADAAVHEARMEMIAEVHGSDDVVDMLLDRGIVPTLRPAQALDFAGDAGLALGLLPGGPLVLDGAPRPRPATGTEVSGGVDGLLGLVPTPEQDGAGSITVTAVERSDGQGRTWIVAIPSTQGGLTPSVVSGNPLDGAGNVEALSRGSAHLADAVRQALAAAGAPEGSDVVLVGHSQGGIHAANLAGSAAFAQAYRVRGVLTAGSPLGEVHVPEDVWELDLADADDLLTGVDGGPNPVGPRRATVVFSDDRPPVLGPGTASAAALADADHPGRAGFGDLPGVWRAVGEENGAIHALPAYQERAALLERADPADRTEVQGIQDALRGLTAGRVVDSRTVALRRADPEAPVLDVLEAQGRAFTVRPPG